MTEQIGNITLDYKYYPGEDLYCDGAVEDELLDIVRNYDESAFYQVIEDRASWPIFYHLSPLRGNIVDWIPVPRDARVLEVGSGCGAVTGALAKKAGSVTCIDLSKKRSMINAYRHRDADNVTIHVGNFKDIEQELPCDYDFIFLIGVFEYGQGYMGTAAPYEDFMRILRKHLKKGGRLVIAIENKFGLKYWAGCKEDHLGIYYSGIEDYPQGGGVRTFTRNGLEKICKAAGVENYTFYYPYPDYKFMTSLYSDKRLPNTGELCANLNNFDRERLLLLDEKNAFDSIIREGLFPLYSNSYVLVTGGPFETVYSKYSNDRAEEFAVRTDILEDTQGKRRVRKTALNEAANRHIAHIEESYRKLADRYRGSRLEINRCALEGQDISLEYLEGQTLEELLDGCLERGDEKAFELLVGEYEKTVGYGEESGVTDYDLIFANILVSGDRWTVLDYEWTFQIRIPVRELVFRALYCYSLGSVKRKAVCERLIRDRLGCTGEEAAMLARREVEFQKYVTGKKLALVELRHKIGNPIIPVQELAERYAGGRHVERVQVYEDKGEGFSEERSYFLPDAYKSGGHIEFTRKLDADVRRLRIDPALDCCMIELKRLELNGETVRLNSKKCLLNGNLISDNIAVFDSPDPNITVETPARAEKEIVVSMDIVRLPQGMAAGLMGSGRKKKWGIL